MLLFLLGCLVSGEVGKDSIDFHIDRVDLQQCHSVSESSHESSVRIAFMNEELSTFFTFSSALPFILITST